MTDQLTRRRGPWRRWIRGVAAGILLAALGGCLANWLVQGMLFPVRVGSGSMAPALLGPHYRHTCRDCGLAWPLDALQETDFSRLVCPNCGALNQLAELQVEPGDRVLVDRWTYRWSAPRRWDLAVFQAAADGAAVKRVVGLPGEQITLRDGDVYADGQIVRKELAELRKLAILVHDDRFRPRSSLPPRWAEEPDGTEGEPPWISFRPWRCFDSPLPRAQTTVVLDNDGYNQGLSRQTHPVFDLLLRFRVAGDPATVLVLRGHNGTAQYLVRIDGPLGQVHLLRDGQPLAAAQLPPGVWTKSAGGAGWEFALVDRQVLLACEGELLLRFAEQDGEDTPRAAVRGPLAYRVERGSAAVTHLSVWRDLHYLDPQQLGRCWHATRLPRDGYLLLGDNVPLSIDGRHQARGVGRNQIVGKALRWDGWPRAAAARAGGSFR